MTVAAILKQKGHDVVAVAATTRVHEAARQLAQRRIGAVVVLGADGSLAGIVSERDIVHALAERGAIILDDPISTIMIREVITCSVEDTVSDLMERMTDNRVRHLPVMGKSGLAGIVSIGDVVKLRIAEAVREAEEMKRYIVS